MTRPAALLVVIVLAAAGCGGEESASGGAVERCVDRLLSASPTDDADSEGAREYVRTTYCERFAAEGWVEDDGVLAVEAQHWLDGSGTCAAGTEGEPTRTVPCDELRRDDPILDCGLLHHVRRSEVRAYLDELDRTVPLRCDDGTPLTDLGVP